MERLANPGAERELQATERAVLDFDRKVQDLLLELDDSVATLPDWVKAERR